VENEVRRDFHERLDQLRLQLLRMGSDVVATIDQARLCFLTLDKHAADLLIAGDDVFDARIESIEAESLELIALQAPVAIDLRYIIVIMRIAQHLERVADLCEDIGVAVKNMQVDYINEWMRTSIDEMARRAARMVERSIACFRERDVRVAMELDAMDDAVDNVNRRFFKEFDRGRTEDLEVAIRVVMISRFFERIADHAVDIGEHVRFLSEGSVLHNPA
jgi:phosphate transport system protein